MTVQGIFGVRPPPLQIIEGGTGAKTAALALTNLGAQVADDQLTDIAGLAVTDGNMIVADGSNWVARIGGWVYGSQVATTSGTAVALSTAIGAAATEVEIILRGVGTDANDQPPIIELGHTAGTYIATGYVGGTAEINATSPVETSVSDGIYPIRTGGWLANDTVDCIIRLSRWDIAEHIWHATGTSYNVTDTTVSYVHSWVDVTSALDSVRLHTPTQSDAFNAGEARIRWR